MAWTKAEWHQVLEKIIKMPDGIDILIAYGLRAEERERVRRNARRRERYRWNKAWQRARAEEEEAQS